MDLTPQHTSLGRNQQVSNVSAVQHGNLLEAQYGAHEARQMKALLSDMRRSVRPLLRAPSIDRVKCDLTKYMYSNVAAPGEMSGAEITGRIMYGEDRFYGTPKDEAQFIRENGALIAESILSIVGKRTVEVGSAGNGPHVSVFQKDSAATREIINAGVDVVSYTGIDFNESFSNRAGRILVEECGFKNLETRALTVDFSKPFQFQHGKNSVPLLYFFGNTIAQFRSTTSKKGKPPLEKLLYNLGQSTNFSGLLFILHAHSRNCNKLVEKYRGTLMESWAKSVWSVLKIAAGDPNFEPCALEYHPTCENGIVSLDFFAKKKTSLKLPGCPDFPIQKGFEIEAGCGEQHSSEAIIKAARKSGWREVPTRFENVNGTYGIILAGKNL